MKNLKNLLLFLVLVNTLPSNSQNNTEKSISILEDLYYNEYYLGEKGYFSLDITLDDLTNKFIFKRIYHISSEISKESIQTFYKDDIDFNSMVVYIYHMGDSDPKLKDRYYIGIKFKTKDESIKYETLDINKNEFQYPIKKTEYIDTFNLGNFNNPPPNVCKKFIDTFASLIGFKEIKYTTTDMKTDEIYEIWSPFE